MNRIWLVYVAALFAASGSPIGVSGESTNASPPRLTLSNCRVPEFKGVARCGVFETLENPQRPDGRRISIHVAVVPASKSKAKADPLVPLMGGPGEDAISAAGYYAGQFAKLREDRDLLLVDQRGTGKSGALHCDLYSAMDPAASLRDLFPAPAVEKCAKELSARADLTQYSYARFADDLETIRKALGYGPMNLFAGSYGTRAAQVFLRSYPQSVRTAFLGSVVPIDLAMPLPFAKTTQAALEGLFDACAQDSSCHAAFPDLRADFRKFEAALESGTATVSLAAGKSVALQRGRVAEWVRSRLYRPSSAALLPWTIHQGAMGNWQPLADAILADAPQYDTALSFGLLFSITCSDDVQFIHEADIVAQTKETFLGDYRVRQQQAACARWPKNDVAADYKAPVRTAVPTLFVSGDADGGTPLSFMQHAAQGFSKSAQVVARGQGHTEWSDCIGRIYEKFLRTAEVKGLPPECAPRPRPPFKTG